MGGSDLLERVLTEADPARTARDARPDAVALAIRDRIMRSSAPRRRRRTLALSVASGLAVATAAVVLSVSVLLPQGEAVAGGPEPLEFSGGEGISETVETAQRTLADVSGPAEPIREVRSASWNFSINGTTGETKVVPELRTVRWNADLSWHETLVLGEAYDPSDASANLGAEVDSAGGEVIETSVEPGGFDTPVPEPFGDSRAEVSEALEAFEMPADPTGFEAATALTAVLSTWTLTNAQESQLLEIVADAEGTEALGSTIDRLGRPVSGLRMISEDRRFAQLVLVSLDTGRIVGVETTNLVENDLVDAGAIMSYTMWDVDEDLVP